MWRLSISAEKTKAVFFSKKTRLQLPELKSQSANIDYVSRYRFHGVILGHRFAWKRLYEVLRGKALRSLTALSLYYVDLSPLRQNYYCIKLIFGL